MNKDQIKGAAKETAGKIQKEVGKATANGTQQVTGAARELAGKAQKKYGDIKQDVKTDAKEKQERDAERQGY